MFPSPHPRIIPYWHDKYDRLCNDMNCRSSYLPYKISHCKNAFLIRHRSSDKSRSSRYVSLNVSFAAGSPTCPIRSAKELADSFLSQTYAAVRKYTEYWGQMTFLLMFTPCSCDWTESVLMEMPFTTHTCCCSFEASGTAT